MILSSWLRKRCLPKYRPVTADGSEKLEEISDKKNDERTKDCISAPFIPIVTSATIRECLGCTSPGIISVTSGTPQPLIFGFESQLIGFN